MTLPCSKQLLLQTDLYNKGSRADEAREPFLLVEIAETMSLSGYIEAAMPLYDHSTRLPRVLIGFPIHSCT
jgi:hypothetical protein